MIDVTDSPFNGDVQSAIAAIAAAGGGRLYLPAGTWDALAVLPSKITIEGDGEATILRLPDGANTHLLEAVNQSGITLRNLTLDGNKANQSVGAVSRCFYALKCSDIRVEDVTIRNAASHGIHISTGAAAEPLSGSERIWMTRVRAVDNGGSGIAASGKYIWATDCIVSGNLLTGFKGIGSYLSAKGVHALNNVAGGFSTGFDIVSEEGSTHVYDACSALDNDGDGFRHQGQVDRIVHRDSVAKGNGAYGIALTASQSVRPASVLIGEGCRLDGNMLGSLYSNAALVTDVRLSPGIMVADFIKRSMVPASVTGTTAETDLHSITIPANTFTPGQRFRVRAHCRALGVNGTKQFRLHFGNANLLFSNQLAGEAQECFVDAMVEIVSPTSQRVVLAGFEIGGQTVSRSLVSTSNVNTAITCKITGQLGSAADAVECPSFLFEPA
jgi:hypothetical protein